MIALSVENAIAEIGLDAGPLNLVTRDLLRALDRALGEVVEEIRVDLPRPRPIVLGDVKEFAAYVERIHRQFERLGVLHGIDVPTVGEARQ